VFRSDINVEYTGGAADIDGTDDTLTYRYDESNEALLVEAFVLVKFFAQKFIVKLRKITTNADGFGLLLRISKIMVVCPQLNVVFVANDDIDKAMASVKDIIQSFVTLDPNLTIRDQVLIGLFDYTTDSPKPLYVQGKRITLPTKDVNVRATAFYTDLATGKYIGIGRINESTNLAKGVRLFHMAVYPHIPDALNKMYTTGSDKIPFTDYIHHIFNMNKYCGVKNLFDRTKRENKTIISESDEVYFVGDLEGRTACMCRLLEDKGIIGYNRTDQTYTFPKKNAYVFQMGDQLDSCRWADDREDPVAPVPKNIAELEAKDINLLFFTDYLDYLSDGRIRSVYGNHEHWNVEIHDENYLAKRTEQEKQEKPFDDLDCHEVTQAFDYKYTDYSGTQIDLDRKAIMSAIRMYVMPHRTVAHVVRNGNTNILVSHAGVIPKVVEALGGFDSLESLVDTLNNVKNKYLKNHDSVSDDEKKNVLSDPDGVIWTRALIKFHTAMCDITFSEKNSTRNKSPADMSKGIISVGNDKIFAQITGHNNLNNLTLNPKILECDDYENYDKAKIDEAFAKGSKYSLRSAVDQIAVVIDSLPRKSDADTTYDDCKPLNKTRKNCQTWQGGDLTYIEPVHIESDRYYTVMTDVVPVGDVTPPTPFVKLTLGNVTSATQLGTFFRGMTLNSVESYADPAATAYPYAYVHP